MVSVAKGHRMLQPVIPLILFAFVATATPGIATTLSTASGAQFGFRRSVPLMVGSAAGYRTFVRELCLDTDLVKDGKPAITVVTPASGGFAAQAAAIVRLDL